MGQPAAEVCAFKHLTAKKRSGTMINNAGPIDNTSHQFRVDLDHHGSWCVWRRLAHNGWTAIETCESHNGAVKLAARLNATPKADSPVNAG